ncbi:MAG: DUF2752 domain-containing protein [Pyrinomonadaceae bacterium]
MQIEETINSVSAGLSGRIMAAASVVGIAGASTMVAAYDPTQVHFFPVCPLFALTGLACPGCGLTRGFHALFQGDVATAFGFNALFPVWAIVIGYVWLSLVVYAMRGKGLPMWPTNPTFLWTFMILLLVFGVVRNIPVYPLNLLFP